MNTLALVKLIQAVEMTAGYTLAILNTHEVFVSKRGTGFVVIVMDGFNTTAALVETYQEMVAGVASVFKLPVLTVQENLKPCLVGICGEFVAVYQTTAMREGSHFKHQLRMWQGTTFFPGHFGKSKEQVFSSSNAWLESEGYCLV